MPYPEHVAAANAAAFQSAMDGHNRALDLVIEEGETETSLFHILASAIEWCDRQVPIVDFDLVLEQVRSHFRDS